MATTQPRIFTFSKGGGSKGDKSMKELVGCSAATAVLPLPSQLHVICGLDGGQTLLLLQESSLQPSAVLYVVNCTSIRAFAAPAWHQHKHCLAVP